MRRLLLFLGSVAFVSLWANRRANASARELDCPSDAIIYQFAMSLGLVILAVPTPSDLRSRDEVLAGQFAPLSGTYGMTEQEFWNRFAFFVRDECRFYVYNYKEQSFSPSDRPMQDLRRWQKTGRI